MKKIDLPDDLHMKVKRWGKAKGLEFYPALETLLAVGLEVADRAWNADVVMMQCYRDGALVGSWGSEWAE